MKFLWIGLFLLIGQFLRIGLFILGSMTVLCVCVICIHTIYTLLGSVSVCCVCIRVLYVSIPFSTWRIMGIVVSVCCMFILYPYHLVMCCVFVYVLCMCTYYFFSLYV